MLRKRTGLAHRHFGLVSLAALTFATVTAPAATAQDRCRTVRALTNLDGRNFADLEIRIARPFGVIVRSGQGDPLPTPQNCEVAAESDAVDLECYWRPGDYALATSLYDDLFSRLQECLGGSLASPTGPLPHGSQSIALRSSLNTLPAAGGHTEVTLRLIETAGAIPAHHYIVLSVGYVQSADD